MGCISRIRNSQRIQYSSPSLRIYSTFRSIQHPYPPIPFRFTPKSTFDHTPVSAFLIFPYWPPPNDKHILEAQGIYISVNKFGWTSLKFCFCAKLLGIGLPSPHKRRYFCQFKYYSESYLPKHERFSQLLFHDRTGVSKANLFAWKIGHQLLLQLEMFCRKCTSLFQVWKFATAQGASSNLL